jgi:hypothetical protein
MGEIIWIGRSRIRRNKHGGSITQGKGGVRTRRKERDRDTGQKFVEDQRKDMRSFEKKGRKKEELAEPGRR